LLYRSSTEFPGREKSEEAKHFSGATCILKTTFARTSSANNIKLRIGEVNELMCVVAASFQPAGSAGWKPAATRASAQREETGDLHDGQHAADIVVGGVADGRETFHQRAREVRSRTPITTDSEKHSLEIGLEPRR
jgi:hypothetical protein